MRTNNFLKISQTFSFSLVNAFLAFGTSIMLSRIYGAVGVAEIGLFLFSVSISFVINAVFGSTSIIYIVSKHNFASVFRTSLLGILLGVVLVAILGYSTSLILNVNIKILIVLSILQTLYVNLLFFLLSKKGAKKYNYIRISQPLLLFLILILFLNYDLKKIDYYYYGLAFSYISPIFYLILGLKSDLFSANRKSGEVFLVFKDFFKYGGLSQLTNGIQLFNYRVSLIFMGFFCSSEDLGVMVLALTIVDGIWMFKNSVALINYVDSAQLIKKEEAFSNIKKLSLLSFSVTCLIVLAVLCLPEKIYVSVFGTEFAGVKNVLSYMVPGVIIMASSSAISSYFAAIGKVYINLIVAVIGVSVFLPILYVLAKKYGLEGAAVANNVPHLIGSLILFCWYSFFVKRNYVITKLLPRNETTSK